jgi:hypothetical protein
MTTFCGRIDPSTSTSALRFGSLPGSPSSSYEHVDRVIVRQMREILDGISVHEA